MGAKYKEVGGGPAVGVADDWANFLKSAMGGGGTPSTAMNSAANGLSGGSTMQKIIADILGSGAGVPGAALASSITRDTNTQRANLRDQFGGSFGSGAQQATAMFNSSVADKIPIDIANLQMGVMGPLMGLISQFAQKGTSQRSVVAEENPFLATLKGLTGAAQGVAGIVGGGGSSKKEGDPGSIMGQDTPLLNGFNIPSGAAPGSYLPNINTSGFRLPQLTPSMQGSDNSPGAGSGWWRGR